MFYGCSCIIIFPSTKNKVHIALFIKSVRMFISDKDKFDIRNDIQKNNIDSSNNTQVVVIVTNENGIYVCVRHC
jgi:hypothetical protein